MIELSTARSETANYLIIFLISFKEHCASITGGGFKPMTHLQQLVTIYHIFLVYDTIKRRDSNFAKTY